MNREILFRGKRIDNGEWVSGYYGQFHNRPVNMRENSHQIFEPREDAYFCGSFIGGLWHIIDPATVGQFTGLVDKNGVRIFEGDVVRTAFSDMEEIGEIVWDEERCKFAYDNSDGERYGVYGTLDIEVIGNIHDHPSLL